ncbi:MAG: MFS transporter [Eubacterium sp.]|nr:MFS transporter [Eubacterium sp.]
MNNITNSENSMAEYSPGRIKAILVAITICMFALGFSMFKLLPMQSVAQDYFQIEEGMWGILNSAQLWFIIICTVPFGFMARKLPVKVSMIISFALIIVGSILQIVATGDQFALFLIGRIIEGGGYGLMGLVGHSITTNLVKPNRVGFWVSFMVTVGMLGQVILTVICGKVLVSEWNPTGVSMQEVFKWILILFIIALVIWIIVIPGSLKMSGSLSDVRPTKEQTMRVFKSKDSWLVAIALICFNVAIVSFSAFVIGNFLVPKGMDYQSAASTYGMTSVIGIISMLVFGVLSDVLKTKRKLATFSFFTGIIALLLLLYLPAGLIWLYVLVFGTLPRSVAGMSSACAPDIAEVPADIPVVNGFRTAVGNIGSVVGTVLMGFILQMAGQASAIYVLCIFMAVGGFCWLFAKKIP